MEAQQLHRGRLIDHIQLVVDDLAASRRFYETIFKVLGIPVGDVNIKAKTTEKLGFTGRGEGIAAEAIALITWQETDTGRPG